MFRQKMQWFENGKPGGAEKPHCLVVGEAGAFDRLVDRNCLSSLTLLGVFGYG